MAKVQIERDPFARMTLVRTRVASSRAECTWCGQHARFAYGWESDGGSFGGWSLPCCSVECYRTVYG